MPDLMTILGGSNSDLYTEIIKENLKERILVFNEDVNETLLENYILYILKWNKEDKDIPIEKRKKITIYINCPGGSTIDGFSMVDVISQSITPIRGICFALVASMGYHILLACHERIAFSNSVLLQHDGEIAIQNSTSKAKDTMKFFDNMEKRTKQYVLSRTKISEEFYDKIYDQEYWMFSDEAKALGCIDKIVGEDISLNEIL
ncbi:ATP-dependent Clp protease proteolytic subunit [Clostridium sp.]|uniref:ATP-dependent Clp protease proteolytic subunit n=1 Tax=Clostridium sp. TaxID=1506 RepID=UPI00321786BD